ncbi:MAG: hypothetical protein OXK76_08870 [Gammaproteobacteria bacterium]|nr:hypothetical protein [Gammaproteobacteria bacterium]
MIEPPWLVDTLDALRGTSARLPHALLIHGPPGWGEERIANALALDLMRLEPGLDAREVAHPDLRWLQPEDGVIKVDSVRLIVDFLVHTPQSAGRKIAVIEDADRMNVNAANALLKSLEEPPPESFIALSTSAPERLLPTVRSRCQEARIRPGTGHEVRAWLDENGIDRQAASQLAVEYAGAPYAIIAAVERGQTPLWTHLDRAARSASVARMVADALREEGLVDLLERWMRIVHRLLREWSAAERPLLLDFAAELAKVRGAALVNTGLNRSMQVQRLLLLWHELLGRIPAPAAPKPP